LGDLNSEQLKTKIDSENNSYMGKIKLLLVDDHLLIREGVKLLLKRHDDIDIVAEAKSGKEVIEYLNAHPNSIDVVLMDINMPGMTGIETTKTITERYNDIKIIALTMHIEEVYIKDMINAGAMGYVLKDSGINELLSAIKLVFSGKKYYSNDVSVTMINSLMNANESKALILSERELEVLTYISKGLTNNQTGELLNISGRTVETHRRNILAKLEVKNTAEMIRYAFENKLVA